MKNKRIWVGMALAIAVLSAIGYQTAGTEQTSSRLASYDEGCRSAAAAVIGRIRYDSGLELGYCSLPAMFEQLVALEQPGLIRKASVRAADGQWQDAHRLRYRRSSADWQAYDRTPPEDAPLYSYRQLLFACARRNCSGD